MIVLENHQIKVEKRVDRLERAIFGHDDPVANVWIDGLFQRMADTSKIIANFVLWVKYAALPMMAAILLLLFILTAHAYGWPFVGELIRGMSGKG